MTSVIGVTRMTQTATPSSRNNGGSKTILVVDDEEFIRTLVRERLEIEGYSLGEASNGKEALAKLAAGHYSILLTDIRMPEMDGISLLREVTSRYPDTAGIVMSAHAELDTAVAALKIGACDYITKPFNFNVLLITIENAIRKKSLERELQDYQVNLEKKVKEQTDLINSVYVRSIDALIKALEAKDFYTRGHSQRVTMYSVAIGKAMGLHLEQIELLRQAAVLHDLGKIGVREAILNKPGRLTPDEFQEITLHPVVSTRILQPIPFFRPLLPAILHHHERFDGKGYPDGIGGLDIPLESRIMSIADTFDAMTSTRAYRKALSLDEANQEIRRCSGTQFDPEIVPVFLEVQGRIEILGDIGDLIMPDGHVDAIFTRRV
ncbi:MAG TPA: HD domain-containing phosphohydrolase [Candidatus Deferrimicrobiaceae bacterium]|nr:HD domain-containing phosphohydrolase [Candidatus Deferrimicrobiaceae bacterium]